MGVVLPVHLPTTGWHHSAPDQPFPLDGGPPFDLRVDGVLDVHSRIDAPRSSIAWRRDTSGNVAETPANTGRVDHDKDGNPLGLLIEGAVDELLSRNRELDHADWGLGRVTIAANAVAAPDGTMTADKLEETADTGEHQVAQTVTPASTGPHVCSIFMRSDVRNWMRMLFPNSTFPASAHQRFDSNAGALGLTGSGIDDQWIEDYGNGWWRCSASSVCDTLADTAMNWEMGTNSLNINYLGTLGLGLFLTGANFHFGAYPTSPIFVDDGPFTRAADFPTAQLPLHSPAVSGIIKGRTAHGVDAAGVGEQVVVSWDDTTTANRFQITRLFTRQMRLEVTAGGLQSAQLDLGTVADNTDFTIAYRLKANDFAAKLAGGTLQTDDNGAMPTGLTIRRLGHDLNGNHLDGHLLQDTVHPIAWDDATLAEMAP